MATISAPLQQFYSPVENRTATIVAQVDPTTGSAFVLWKHILSLFENITCVRAGGVDIKFMLDADYEEYIEIDQLQVQEGVLPFRIPFFEGGALDVIQVDSLAIASKSDPVEPHQENFSNSNRRWSHCDH
ncbi:hypothetical protein BG011_006158 [Mortierella polycephala]|uniref:Uncharacterized protein n=1 Tax=Mortierella polycephala TaxID=41804 RepID=A0A9P6PVD3_9FUNG|nr:hypothetical protein BG011_006158 [Mortierella polycephala]